MITKLLRRFHMSMTAVWFILIIPTVLWWKDSILWVALMSVWANIMAHFAAYMAARAEKREAERE